MTVQARVWYWYWRPRRIMAGMVVGFWAHMASYPQQYTTATYTVVERWAGLRTWAIGFVILGAIMAATAPRSIWPVVALGSLLGAWTAGLLEAVRIGLSQSPAGFWFLFGFVQMLVWGIGRDLETRG